MGVNLDRIVRANVTRATRVASRRSFGMLLIAAYHAVFPERVREYSDPSEMLDDGFDELHPAYLAAVAFCQQENRPSTFKVGRRVGTPDQTLRFVPATPVEGEEFTVSVGGIDFTVTADATPTVAEIIAAFVLLMMADPDAIIASGVTSTATIQNLTSASYNGIRAGVLSPPRNVTFTLNAHADWDATVMTVTGLDGNGRTITESFNIPNGGDTVLVGAKVFSEITNVNVPAQTGTNGTLLMGVGEIFGTSSFGNPDLDVTATDGTTYLQVSADDAGAWHAYSASSNITIDDTTAEPATTLATDLNAIQAADPDWYGLVVADAQSHAQILATAVWMETQVGIYFAGTGDSDVATDVDTDIASTLLAADYFRTAAFYSRENPFLCAAGAGYLFSQPPGSATLALKTLSGQTADEFSATAVGVLIGQPESPSNSKRVTIYASVTPTGVATGTNVTLGGMVAGAEWIDIIYGIDYLRALIQERAFNRLLESPKLPFTAGGIDAFLGAVRSALRTMSAEPYNFLVADSILVEGTAIEDVDAGDKQARFYDGARWDATVQGAIQAAEINGTVRP